MYTQSRCCHPYYPPCSVYYVPVIWVPDRECCENLTVPRDVAADATNTAANGLVGGTEKASLSLEYLVETGASSPSVQVTLTAPDGTTSDWSDTTPKVGYHVHEELLKAKPGTKVTLTVSAATARVRWCERICC